MQAIEFQLTGEQKMYCVGCETRVAYVLRQLPGVRDVRANAKTQHVRVVVDVGGDDERRADRTETKRARLRSTLKGRCRMNTATFKIEGMHCDGCASNIQRLLGSSAGVQKATASFKEGQARVLYDAKTTAEDDLVAVIERAGYRVVDRSST